MAQAQIISFRVVFPDPVQACQFAVVLIFAGDVIAGVVAGIAMIFLGSTSDLEWDINRIGRRSKGHMSYCKYRNRHKQPLI